MTGERFSHLVVERRAQAESTKGARWLCRCDCGATTSVLRSNLITGNVVSCGCQRVKRTHGQARSGKQTKLYRAWCNIHARCTNPNVPAFARYGARGITMCAEWSESFERFAAEVGEAPTPRHSIDRIDNERGYEPGNVRWADAKTQANNRRKRSAPCN